MTSPPLLALAVLSAPVSAQVAPPGNDASSTLGRDVAPSTLDENRRRKPVAAPVALPNVTVADLTESGSVQIGAVLVTGLDRLSQADFADIAEAYAGRVVDTAGLRTLARAVADRARSRGYIFAGAAIPPQQLNVGIVRVTLDEGAIDEVRISGHQNQRVKMLLDTLVGKAVQKRLVERQLLLAGDVPGVQIATTRYEREGGRGILHVQVEDQRARGYLSLDNFGTSNFGPVRLRLETNLAGLLDDDDQFSTYTTLTPAQPRELTYIAARYSNIITAGGTQLSLLGSAGRTHDRFDAIGRSRSLSASLSTPLLRANKGSFWLNGEVGYLTVDQDFSTFASQRDDLATITLSGWGNVRLGKSRLFGGAGVTRGLTALGATEAGDPQASRPDGSGQFTKVNAWFNWTGSITPSVSLRLAANGQLASRPLLAPQEIGLGGPGFGRGYDFSERFGDQGALGLVELRRNFDQPTKFLGWAQIYGFVDGGYVDNLRGGFGGGTLVSGGGGLRAGSGRAELGVEVAAPINADRFESNDRSPKVNLVLSYGF